MDANALQNLAVGDHELEPGVASESDLTVRAGGAHHDDALRAVLVAQRETFGNGRDAERRRARTERGAGDVDRTVPVTVGLDDRPEPGAAECAQQSAHVAPQRTEVDRDLRAVHRTR